MDAVKNKLLAVALSLCFGAPVLADAARVPELKPISVAAGVWMIPEVAVLDREPDGNSVAFTSGQGLIVFDTGRHAWHQRALLELAAKQRQPIVAVINSHWHLDHTSGNRVLRAQFPRLKVYASSAVDGALSGFLAESAASTANYLNDSQIPEALKDDLRADLETIRLGRELRPDILVTASRPMRIAGKNFEVHLAVNAATAGDVWLYEKVSQLAIVGDLVTFPAPYLDTACPEGWRSALAQIDATPFRRAIPGHGPVLSHSQFAMYRRAFERFISCTKNDQPDEECATNWAADVAPILSADLSQEQRAISAARYYVQMLRANAGRSRFCNDGIS
jgi:glyoxylase-like metal-dependent hydrolase (beta-lactamase superfamily II)